MALDLIAPVTPDGNASDGPKLFLQGLGQGLQAMARFAEMKRQSESDVLQIAARERMAQQEHELGKQKMVLDAGYREREYDLKAQELQSRQPVFEAQTRMYDALGHYRDAKTIQTSEGLTSVVSLAQKREAVEMDFRNRMEELELFDPNPKNPVAFYQAAKRLKQEFKYADLPNIRDAFKQLDAQTQQHTFSLKMGERQREVPIGQIVENLNDPSKADLQKKVLEDSGYFKEVSEYDKRERGWFESWFSRAPVIKKKVPSDLLQSMTEQGEGVDFSNSAPRVKPGWKGSGDRTRDPMGSGDYIPQRDESGGEIDPDDPQASARPVSVDDLFRPSQVEIYLQQAKTAIAGGADMKAVAQRLQEEYGIDPNRLWMAA